MDIAFMIPTRRKRVKKTKISVMDRDYQEKQKGFKNRWKDTNIWERTIITTISFNLPPTLRLV